METVGRRESLKRILVIMMWNVRGYEKGNDTRCWGLGKTTGSVCMCGVGVGGTLKGIPDKGAACTKSRA